MPRVGACRGGIGTCLTPSRGGTRAALFVLLPPVRLLLGVSIALTCHECPREENDTMVELLCELEYRRDVLLCRRHRATYRYEYPGIRASGERGWI